MKTKLFNFLISIAIVSAFIIIFSVAFYETAQPQAIILPQIVFTSTSESITPLPQQLDLNPEKVALGERLFHDAQLSRNGSVSCATCHDLATGGVDRLPQSVGIDGRIGNINAPTVFNSHFNFAQFWDGRAADLNAQTSGPLQNPVEMDNT